MIQWIKNHTKNFFVKSSFEQSESEYLEIQLFAFKEYISKYLETVAEILAQYTAVNEDIKSSEHELSNLKNNKGSKSEISNLESHIKEKKMRLNELGKMIDSKKEKLALFEEKYKSYNFEMIELSSKLVKSINELKRLSEVEIEV